MKERRFRQREQHVQRPCGWQEHGYQGGSWQYTRNPKVKSLLLKQKKKKKKKKKGQGGYIPREISMAVAHMVGTMAFPKVVMNLDQ